MVRGRTQRRTRDGERETERERERERELERKGEKKKRQSALPAVACARPTLIRRSVFFFFSLVFFPLLFCALHSLAPPTVCARAHVRVFLSLTSGPRDQNRHHYQLHFAKDFLFIFF